MAQPVEQAKKIDALADHFEKEWKAGRNMPIERILARTDDSGRSVLLQALVEVEIKLRRQKGEQPTPAEYRARFPKDQTVIQTAFDGPSKRLKAASQDTSVSKDSVKTGTYGGQPPAAPTSGKLPATIGRFQVEALLGTGGFGRVYRARDPELDRQVAIKVPLAGKLESDEDVERFLREARTAATLLHPNICPVHEVGRVDGAPYLVMGYVDGKSLADQLRERKTPIPVKQAILIVRKLASALAAAHAKGIIHRDLKPANVMIDKERKDVVVMDFGLARRAARDEAQITQSGQIMGTPAYMSPEQARGDAKKVGPASDIYSLGVLLYEMVSGQRPFNGSVAEVLSHVLHSQPELPSTHRKDLDRRLDDICAKALAKDPAQRYGSMKAFADALGACLTEDTAVAVKTEAEPKKKKAPTETHGFGEVLEALSAEHREEAKQAIADAVRKSRAPRWQILVGLGLLGMILLGTVIILFTRSGDVYVQVVLNTQLDQRLLEDGTIRFLLDNNPLPVEDLKRPIELKTGEHTLVAYRGKDEVQRYVFVVGRSDDGKEASIKIQNKTLYMPRPEEADPNPWIALFNGKDLTGWLVESGDTKNWQVNDGAIVTSGLAFGDLKDQTWLLSEKPYTDFIARFDFMAEKGIVNSGFAIRAVPGERMTSGNPPTRMAYPVRVQSMILPAEAGPRGQITATAHTGDVIVNHDPQIDLFSNSIGQKPAGQWNQMEVELRGQSIRVRLNGESVLDASLDNLIKNGGTCPGLKRTAGRIGFRRLLGTIRLSNIQIKELAPPGEEGFVPLFNGKDLTGWGDITHYWHVEGNALVGEVPPQGLPKNMFLSPNLPLPLKDFELRLEAKMIKGNSGIQVRSKRVEDNGFTTMVGPQVEIAHGSKYMWSSLVTEPNGEPSLSAVVDKVLLKPADFNEMHVRCVGKHITITLNGTVTVDADFPTMPEEGLIGLQIHKSHPGMRVEFRNIRLKELSPGSAQADPAPTAAERQAIAAVFKLGGRVAVVKIDKFMEASQPGELPPDPYSLFGVDLTRRPAQDGDLAVLAGLPRLKDVAVGGTKVTDAGLAHLANVPKLGGLWLDDTAITGSGFRFLDKADNLAVLYLNGTKINDASLQALGRRPRLAELYVNHTSIGDEALKCVANFSRLGQLGLSGTKITNAGLAHLKGHPTLHNLFLANTAITDDGLVHLQDLGRTAKEGLLILNDTKITDKGLAHLSGLTWLVRLDLTGTAVTDDGLIHLHNLTRLGVLGLARTKVTPAGIQRLRKALPKCQITVP